MKRSSPSFFCTSGLKRYKSPDHHAPEAPKPAILCSLRSPTSNETEPPTRGTKTAVVARGFCTPRSTTEIAVAKALLKMATASRSGQNFAASRDVTPDNEGSRGVGMMMSKPAMTGLQDSRPHCSSQKLGCTLPYPPRVRRAKSIDRSRAFLQDRLGVRRALPFG